MYDGHKGSRKTTSRPSRTKIGNRKPPNRHSFESDTEGVSRLAEKLKTTDEPEIEIEATFGYRILNFISVFGTLSQILKCQCGESISFLNHACVALDSNLLCRVKSAGIL